MRATRFAAILPLALAGLVDLPAPGGGAPAPFVEKIAGTALELEMVPLPPQRPDEPILYLSRTEITWDLYDAFVYRLDEPEGAAPPDAGADAVARPSKPYIAMDRGFGHAGFPAISMSAKNAEAFCAWLSEKTGRRYRLPTADEWRRACRAARIDAARLETHAWFAANSERRTHRVGTKEPDALGLRDLYGNAAEWCTDAAGPIALGGAYLDPAADVGCGAVKTPAAEWNASDPQFPKSPWWLADAGFVGVRVACDAPAAPQEKDP
jgi:hypothetical protein